MECVLINKSHTEKEIFKLLGSQQPLHSYLIQGNKKRNKLLTVSYIINYKQALTTAVRPIFQRNQGAVSKNIFLIVYSFFRKLDHGYNSIKTGFDV